MANITLHEMTKTPFVLGVFSRLKASGLALSNFYNLTPGSPATEVSPRRSLAYDLFDNTRTMAQGRAPYVGPAKIAPKKVGTATAHALRMYEAIPLPYERIYQGRALGQQIGSIDANGQAYVGRQQKFGAQRMANAVEFMVSRMFRGGFSLKLDGEEMQLNELGDGTVDVVYDIPANNLNQANGIIAVDWDEANAPIVTDLLQINQASEALTGYVQKHIWINSTTYGYLLGNDQLRSVRGTANRLFDTQTGNQIQTTGDARESGYTVIFGACPQFVWHIYDGVSHVGTEVDSDSSNLSMFIPDEKVLITPEPEPGGWYGMAVCSEPVMETDQGNVIYPNGLHAWRYPTNDPPGMELRILHNLVPLLYNPKALYWLDCKVS